MNWDWKSLVRQIVPIVLSWLLGALGVGIPQVTPSRVVNVPPAITK